MSPALLLVVGAIVALAGLAQTVAGFGFSLLAVPPLGVVLDPKDAVALAMLCLVINSALLTWSERHHIDWGSVRILLVGAVPGLPIGMVLLDLATVGILRLALAAAIFWSVAFLLSDIAAPADGPGLDLAAGFATGLLTTSLNTNGPPTVIALQARRLEPHQFRPTVSAVLGLTSAVGAVLFLLGGRITGDVSGAMVVAVPALVVGWYLGIRIRPRVRAGSFRRIIITLLLAAGATTLFAAIA